MRTAITNTSASRGLGTASAIVITATALTPAAMLGRRRPPVHQTRLAMLRVKMPLGRTISETMRMMSAVKMIAFELM